MKVCFTELSIPKPKKQLFEEIPGADTTLFAFFSAKLNDLFKLLQ